MAGESAFKVEGVIVETLPHQLQMSPYDLSEGRILVEAG
jgi:hypothetical protein